MAKIIVSQQKILLGKVNLTRQIKSLDFGATCELEETTTLGNTSNYKERTPLIPDCSLSLDGFWEAGAGSLDDKIFAGLGSTEEPVAIVLKKTSLAGDPALFFVGKHADYKPLGSFGAVAPFTAKVSGDGRLLNGFNLKHGTITGGGQGTALNLGAVSSAQTIYAALCLTAYSGSATFYGHVKSSPDEAFTTPTTRISFTTLTATGSEQKTLVGPVTDAWWRVEYALASGSVEFTVVMAIVTT